MKRPQLGLSLMEVLLSIVILLVIASVSTYLITSFSQNTRARQDTQLQAFGRSYMDELKAYWTISGNYNTNILPNISGTALQPPQGFTYKVNIKNGTTNAAIINYDYNVSKIPTPYTDPTPVPFKKVNVSITDTKNTTTTFSILIAQPTQ